MVVLGCVLKSHAKEISPQGYSKAIILGNIQLVCKFRNLYFQSILSYTNFFLQALGSIFPSFAASVSCHFSLMHYFFPHTHSSEKPLSPILLPTSFFFFLLFAANPFCPFSPLCVEIRLQQWTLRVMVMECIWGASSFLSPTCMQNHPNGESLAPVYITKRGAGTMVTPLLSLKTHGRWVCTITPS